MAYTVTAYSGDKITVGSVNSRTEFTTNVDAGMRGDAGYMGSVGYTGSQGIGYTGSRGIGYAGSQGTVNTQIATIQTINTNKIVQSISTYVGTSGTITQDSDVANYLIILYPTGNMDLNLRNVNLEVGQYITVKNNIVQSNTEAYMVQSITVDGETPTIFWDTGTVPAGDLGKINEIEFEIYKYSVLGYIAKASTSTYG